MPTPVLVALLKVFMRRRLRFEPMKAPPPKPMIAMPVAMPGAIGKPFHQGGNRRDVTEPEPAAAEHAVAEIDQPELVPPDPKSGNDEAAAKTERGHRHRLARTDPFHPAPENRRGSAEEEDGEAENPGQLRLRPVVRRGSVIPIALVSGSLKTLKA